MVLTQVVLHEEISTQCWKKAPYASLVLYFAGREVGTDKNKWCRGSLGGRERVHELQNSEMVSSPVWEWGEEADDISN